jgi:hypothetical protein
VIPPVRLFRWICEDTSLSADQRSPGLCAVYSCGNRLLEERYTSQGASLDQKIFDFQRMLIKERLSQEDGGKKTPASWCGAEKTFMRK